jgi:hypothetical protein
MRATFCVLASAMLVLALGACGESSEDKAQATVCDARADIGKQVDTLTSLTATTVTKDAVTQSLDAIKSDLSDMSSTQADLSQRPAHRGGGGQQGVHKLGQGRHESALHIALGFGRQDRARDGAPAA